MRMNSWMSLISKNRYTGNVSKNLPSASSEEFPSDSTLSSELMKSALYTQEDKRMNDVSTRWYISNFILFYSIECVIQCVQIWTRILKRLTHNYNRVYSWSVCVMFWMHSNLKGWSWKGCIRVPWQYGVICFSIGTKIRWVRYFLKRALRFCVSQCAMCAYYKSQSPRYRMHTQWGSHTVDIELAFIFGITRTA